MDFPAIIGILNDLPSTFRREGPPYAQFIDSVATAFSRYTLSADAVQAQVRSFSAPPLDGWLDVWGLLFGIPRHTDESNANYAARILETVLAWVGTLPAIQVWVALFAVGGSATDNGPSGLGFSLEMPASMTLAQINTFLLSLGRIRPAGMPFKVSQAGIGLFLGTVDFLGDGMIVGNYLTTGDQPVALMIPATTLSSQPLIPALLLQDPTINPSLNTVVG